MKIFASPRVNTYDGWPSKTETGIRNTQLPSWLSSVSSLSLLSSLSNGNGGSRIFPRGGAPTPKSAIIFQFFAENCMKMKEFGPRGGGVPGAPVRSADLVVFVIVRQRSFGKVIVFTGGCLFTRGRVWL